MAEEMELALRTPLNTIIGYSELLLEDADDINIDNFASDINKIKSSGRLLETELKNIISFDSANVGSLENQNLNKGNLSLVQDVLDSIVPIDKNR